VSASVAYPFLRISPENITASPWLVSLDAAAESALEDRVDKWDYLSKLVLSRSVSVDLEGVAEDLDIDISRLSIAVVTTLGTGGARGDRLKRIVSRCQISTDDQVAHISIEPLGLELSQTIKLVTEVILDAPGSGGRLAPKQPGMRLWSDSQTSYVEPDSARFPVETSNFSKLFKDQMPGALYYLSLSAGDWEQDFGNAARLYLNSEEIDFCVRFSAGDETVLRLVMSAIVNQLVRRAISDESFSLDERSSLPTSINAIVRSWIQQAFPNQSMETVRTMSAHNPARFEAALASLGLQG
jgi:hypothetical protein